MVKHPRSGVILIPSYHSQFRQAVVGVFLFRKYMKLKLDYRRKIKKYCRIGYNGKIEFSDKYEPNLGFSIESSMLDIHEIFEDEQARIDFVNKQKEYFKKINKANQKILKETAEFLYVKL